MPEHLLSRRMRAARPAVTLLELLVVLVIIAVLLLLVMASVAKVRAASKCVVCMNNLRRVSSEFFHFADEYSHAYRGDSDRNSNKLFRLEDFQEKLYAIHEFWDGGPAFRKSLEPGRNPLVCPAGGIALHKQKDLACNAYAVAPPDGITVGFNMRLEQVSVLQGGMWRLQRTRLSSRILDHPQVPLALGVEGASAVSQGVLPYYSAPPAGDPGLYGSARFWFPSARHGDRINVAFIGGHVSRSPVKDNLNSAPWRYQPHLQ